MSDLLTAALRHCTCVLDDNGVRVTMCPPHTMFKDQRALDGLVFARRMNGRLLAEEFGIVGCAPAV